MPSATGNVDIVVVNWNAGELLGRCLQSITEFGDGFVASTTVVDNGSSDGSADLADRFPAVACIRSNENQGFAKACNLGARRSTSEYLLFLNPDAELYPHTLPRVLSYMASPENSVVGICGVQLLDDTGHASRSCARFPSPRSFVLNAIGLDRLFAGSGFFMSDWDHLDSRAVDHVIGAFYFVRRDLFVALKGFDEDFFVYLEDMDFSLRAARLGRRSAYLADVQAYHAGGGTSRQIRARRLFYSIRSRLVYSFKHFSTAGASAVLLATLLIEPVTRSMSALVRRSGATFKETLAAYGMLWRWLPSWRMNGQQRQ